MVKNFQLLWKDVTNSMDEATAVRALASIVDNKEGRTFVSGLKRKDAEHCIEILDRGIAGDNLKTTADKQAFFVTLRRLAGLHGKLPESIITGESISVSHDILASGGFADVRRGTYMGRLVAVKTLRTAAQDDPQRIRKQFCKEVVLWSTLSHPHVLKLVGVYGDMDKGQFSTVSEWMEHGSVMQYIKKNHANRLELLHGTAQGLKYIHSVGLTHGDLKGANILMSNDTPPRACLADFGFMTMVLDPQQPMSCSAQLDGGTITFMAPELLAAEGKGSTSSPESDIYAFGLLVFQVLTGEIPFLGIRMMEFGFSVLQGLRPAKPANASAIGFSEPLWEFVQRCWDGDMNSRPKVTEVVTHLAKAASSWHGLMPPCSQAENVVHVSQEPTSESLMQHCRIIFDPLSATFVESPTDSRTTSGPFSYPGSPSTACTEPPQDGLSQAVIKLSAGQPQSPSGTVQQRPQELPDDLHGSQHVACNSQPPLNVVPPRKQKQSQRLRMKLREFFGRSRLSQHFSTTSASRPKLVP